MSHLREVVAGDDPVMEVFSGNGQMEVLDAVSADINFEAVEPELPDEGMKSPMRRRRLVAANQEAAPLALCREAGDLGGWQSRGGLHQRRVQLLEDRNPHEELLEISRERPDDLFSQIVVQVALRS